MIGLLSRRAFVLSRSANLPLSATDCWSFSRIDVALLRRMRLNAQWTDQPALLFCFSYNLLIINKIFFTLTIADGCPHFLFIKTNRLHRHRGFLSALQCIRCKAFPCLTSVTLARVFFCGSLAFPLRGFSVFCSQKLRKPWGGYRPLHRVCRGLLPGFSPEASQALRAEYSAVQTRYRAGPSRRALPDSSRGSSAEPSREVSRESLREYSRESSGRIGPESSRESSGCFGPRFPQALPADLRRALLAEVTPWLDPFP